MVKLENTEILNIQVAPGGSKYASNGTFIHLHSYKVKGQKWSEKSRLFESVGDL